MAGRTANKVKTIYVRICTTPKMVAYLDALVIKGLYGKTAPEVAEGLLRERVRELIKAKELKDLDEEIPTNAGAK